MEPEGRCLMVSQRRSAESVPREPVSVSSWAKRVGVEPVVASEIEVEIAEFLKKVPAHKECLSVGVSGSVGEKGDLHLWIHILAREKVASQRQPLKKLRAKLNKLDTITLHNGIALHVEYFSEDNLGGRSFQSVLAASEDLEVLLPRHPKKQGHAMDGLYP
jgi:hypothetical protein